MDGKSFEELSFAELTEMLVNMAVQGKKKADLYTLNHEFEELSSQIAKISSKLSEVKEMTDDKYIDAAGRMQDQTFTMQFQKDLADLKEEKASLDSKLEELKEQEEKAYEEVTKVNENLSKSADEIHKMQARMAKAKDDEAKNRYEARITKAQAKLKENEAYAEKINKDYNELQESIESIVASIEDREEEIKTKEEALKEIEDRLKSNDAYVDQMRKLADTEKKERLTEELKEKEARKKEIATNPVFLANQAVQAHLEGDPTLARKKCGEIAKIATTNNAYINETNKESLKEALVAAEEDRNAFHESLAGKTYDSTTNSITDFRINYLNRRIISYQQKISALQAEIVELDLDQKYGTDTSIEQIEAVIATIAESIKKYEELLSQAEEISADEKTELQSSYEQEKESFESAKAIRDGYTENYLEDLEKIESLNDEIQSCEESIKTYKAEIATLEKGKLLSGASNKDILAQREDQRILEEKVKAVMDIKTSLNFSKTPDQVLEQIEKILGVVITPADLEETIEETKEVPVVEESTKEETPAVEEIPEEEIKEPVLEQEEPAELVPGAEKPQAETNDNIAFEPAFGSAETKEAQPEEPAAQDEPKLEETQEEVAKEEAPKQEEPIPEATPTKEAVPEQTVTVNKDQIVDNLANTGKIPVVGESKKKVTSSEAVAVKQGEPVPTPEPVQQETKQQSESSDNLMDFLHKNFQQEQPAQQEPVQENESSSNLMAFLNSNFQNVANGNNNMAEFLQSSPAEQEVGGPKL